ncbi:uncharacterized protein RAG0_10193 [Rhynchosporium agropyri]|uniref:BZIP domain-containing protein n=1 Tax=Rhynchosporium agropyri TaxID=914238 RepID=A0A1E1KYX1_9HELO|nr:uncharacterized protein RAG0_10193 [Rhynchosporium agropyri]
MSEASYAIDKKLSVQRRRIQNRESQNSFRERQKLHVEWLEEQVRGLRIKHTVLERLMSSWMTSIERCSGLM